MDAADQYVVLLYWNPLFGCMCVKEAKALPPASESQSIREFIISQGSVTPGRITPVK
jgi:hypothetical protein